MKAGEAKMLVATLMAAYPRSAWPEPTRNLYVEMMRFVDLAEGRRTVDRVIATLDWPPSLAELRRVLVEERLQLPYPDDAWGMAAVHAAARRPGAPRRYCVACASTGTLVGGDPCRDCGGTGELDELDLDRMPPVPSPIPEAVRAIGGWRRIRESERPDFVQRDFLASYGRLRGQRIEREALALVGADGDSALVSAAVGEIEAAP